MSHLAGKALLALWHHLRGHESWGPCSAGQQGIIPLKLVTHTKVCYLHVPVISQKQVWGLNISVDDLLVVHWGEDQEGEEQGEEVKEEEDGGEDQEGEDQGE